MKLLVRISERVKGMRGQSMTEYALIMAAIAVAAFAAYVALGKGIVNLIANVTSNL
jgi:Flp pilus assembly pilin Flp